MKREEIYFWDIKRILFGEAPPVFLLEVFFRTLIIYAGLLFIVRLLGKRMAGQLTITELAVMLTLGAIVAPAFQMPERGIVMGLFILLCILGLQRLLTYLNFKNATSEELTQGSMSMLVEDGKLRLDEMKKARITPQELFAKLRESEIDNLGEVERVYLEACGIFSIYKVPKPKPGLFLMPPGDNELLKEQHTADGLMACITCGYTFHHTEGEKCPHCGNDQWMKAVI